MKKSTKKSKNNSCATDQSLATVISHQRFPTDKIIISVWVASFKNILGKGVIFVMTKIIEKRIMAEQQNKEIKKAIQRMLEEISDKRALAKIYTFIKYLK